MEAADEVFAGSISELHDRLLVPLIFSPYADDLARRRTDRRAGGRMTTLSSRRVGRTEIEGAIKARVVEAG